MPTKTALRPAAGSVPEADALPDDVAALRGLIVHQALMIKKLKAQLATLRRHRFGTKSEALDQPELAIEEMEEAQGAAEAAGDAGVSDGSEADAAATRRQPKRRPLPSHLPREEIVHAPDSSCSNCGEPMRPLGQDVREVLDYVPGRFVVHRHVRPKLSCRACGTVAQEPMPSLPIERGTPGPGLIAHVLVSKYADHLPLYRQAQIYEREGVSLDRSTMADWVGRSASLLHPLVDAIGRHALGGAALFNDDTPVPVLDPGRGRTKTGRLWAYIRDERPWAGPAPPAAFYRYSPDRKGDRPAEHMKPFSGILHADGYAGYDRLYGERTGIAEMACMAHVRRKLFDIAQSTGSPVAKEALERIAQLYAVEKQARGLPPHERLALRQREAAPVMDDLRAWMDGTLAQLPGRSSLA